MVVIECIAKHSQHKIMWHTARRINAYFIGEYMTNTMLRIRGMKYMGRYKNLIDEQLVIGWDNLLRGNFLEGMENTTESIQD